MKTSISYKMHTKKIGGIHGSGFNSPEDMVENIPFWKLFKRGDKIIACRMYKFKGGRKSVASGSDGSDEGKSILMRIIMDDFTRARSWGEISDAMIAMLLKTLKTVPEKNIGRHCT